MSSVTDTVRRIKDYSHPVLEDLKSCAYADPDRWFLSDKKANKLGTVSPQNICHSCPLRSACAKAALDQPEDTSGIWAGVQMGTPDSTDKLKTVAQRSLDSDLERLVRFLYRYNFDVSGTSIPQPVASLIKKLSQ